jgi:(p)ppGpp synthase/HD superfamily hydrolase
MRKKESVQNMWNKYTVDEIEMIQRAYIFAESAHNSVYHRRKYTNLPYIVHPVEVAGIVSSVPDSTAEMVMSALLHDTVEDTNVDILDIKKAFGDTVAYQVWMLTKQTTLEDGNRATRKAIDMRHTAEADDDVKTIKLADLISNSKDIIRFDKSFAKIFMSEVLDYLEFLDSGDSMLFERL